MNPMDFIERVMYFRKISKLLDIMHAASEELSPMDRHQLNDLISDISYIYKKSPGSYKFPIIVVKGGVA
jgi:hypothetical protein